MRQRGGRVIFYSVPSPSENSWRSAGAARVSDADPFTDSFSNISENNRCCSSSATTRVSTQILLIHGSSTYVHYIVVGK